MGAGCAGFVVNHFEMPVFGGTALLGGSFFSLLTAFCFGPVMGGIAAAIAFSKTWIDWQNSADFFCYTLEAVSVGWLMQKRRLGVLSATGLYWLFAGLPLTALFVSVLREIPYSEHVAMLVKYPLNGLLAAAAAMFVGNSAWFRRWLGLKPSDDSKVSLRQLLFRRFGVIAVLPLAMLILLLGQRFDRTLRASAELALEDDARDIAELIDAYLLEHRRDLITLARQLQIDAPGTAKPNERLEAILREYPGFITLLLADRSGKIVAYAPTHNAAGAPLELRGMNVGDRDYFTEVVRTNRPYISGIFRGRGFGNDLIVAVSAPVFGPDGTLSFVLEGSLNLKTLVRTLAANERVNRRDLMVADRTGKVLLTVGEVNFPPLSELFEEPIYRALASTEHTITYDLHLPDRPRPERHLAIATRTAMLGWPVVLLEPLWATQYRVAVFYSVAGLWAAVAISVALLLARGTALEITGQLQQLARRTRALVQGDQNSDDAEPSYPSSELTEISRDIQDTARTLLRSNAELSTAVRDRDQSHAQLRQLLLHLDDRVRDRTRQLDEARNIAESASQAKSEFLASMSHELRTPLNVILGMSEVLREQTLGPLTPDQIASVSSVEESGRHLLTLINDILDLSKIEAGMLELDVQEVSARDIGESSLRFVRESAQRKRITIESAYRPPSPLLHADGRRLKQILVNLLSNAVKFTPEGGRIHLQVAERADGSRLDFSVRDTGIGIAPEQLPKLFKSFQQIDSALNRKYAGTGLGLALVKRMAEMHGGEVTVESEAGKGALFTVSIPLKPGAVSEAALVRAPSKSPFRLEKFPGSPLILIAEDHPTNRLLLERYLGNRGCRLIFATDGLQAIDRAIAEHPALILMDVQMPLLDGLEATRRLRANPSTAKIPIIALTALARPEDRLRCLEAGADAYLSKPHHLAELDRLMLEHLARA